jgi:hypothetical protein
LKDEQMARGRNWDKFRCPLDNAKDDDDQPIRK